MPRAGRLVVGTSGWVYPDWLGTVYPETLKSRDTFAFYRKQFDSVELNATFYHFPRASTVEKWLALGGSRFTWSVKAWRWLTHVKRLHGVAGDLKDFLDRVAPLTDGGVVLFQLPPSFQRTPRTVARLDRFLARFPKDLRAAVEFRHNSWFVNDTYTLLTRRRVALVGVSAPGIQGVFDVRTGPFAYFRLHGVREWYNDAYSRQELKTLAQAARRHLQHGDCYVYFDNTAGGQAFNDALAFKDLVG